MYVFSQWQGLAVLVGFAAALSGLVYAFSRGFRSTKVHFLVANRAVGMIPASLSIAAAWVWAPALFLSAEKAYTQGWVGLFWFLVPNVGCLILFAFFAEKIRLMFPQGFTLSGYMGERHSKRVQNVYLFALGMLAACSFAVQLLAGGKILAIVTGLPYGLVTILLALIPVGYMLYSGLKASIVSDLLQMVIVLAIGGSLVGWAVVTAGGIEIIGRGLHGTTGTFDSLFSGDGLKVFYTFGIPVSIGLMSGPFGDQSFWQRAFAVEQKSVRSAFISGAFIFAIVPLTFSVLGFLAAGMGIHSTNASRINLEMITKLLPGWAIIPFVYVLIAKMVSTLDSNLAAIASLAGHDLLSRQRKDDRNSVMRYSTLGMLMLVLCGVAIANIPGLSILYLFLFYGTLRSSTFFPTIITIVKKEVSEAGMFYGILTSLAIGLPVFAYGNLFKITPMIIGGSVFTVLASGIIVLAASCLRR